MQAFIARKLIVDERNELFNAQGMKLVQYPSDLSKVREYAAQILMGCPEPFREENLLEGQLSELIKNAIKHGNRSNPEKMIRVWYDLRNRARFIVEDQGEGFTNLDAWNEFFVRRQRALHDMDLDTFLPLACYRTADEFLCGRFCTDQGMGLALRLESGDVPFTAEDKVLFKVALDLVSGLRDPETLGSSFFLELLQSTLAVVEEADYGSVAHSKPISRSLIVGLDVGPDYRVNLPLDIRRGSQKHFSDNSKRAIEAQIVSAADVYDALRDARPYKVAFTPQDAPRRMRHGDHRLAPGAFNPEILSIVEPHWEAVEQLWMRT